MKVTLKWLNDYMKINAPVAEISDKLTQAGLEVAEIKIVGGWKNVAVGEIRAINPHPNADKLRLATVNLGTGEQTVVCGAPNLVIGSKIAFASVGAELYDGHSGKFETLKPAKIRGVVSEGMVCSEKELGISENHEGILVLPADAPVGMSLAEYMGDTIIDIDVTPNRPDCMSVIGIAREIAAQLKIPIKIPEISYREETQEAKSLVNIEIKEPDLCPRYCASILTDVKPGPSPDWMQRRLTDSGMRPISNVVDITNYVMLEYGQPLHAFDYTEIANRQIVVRRARQGEIITTLDGVQRTLNDGMLVISDGGRALAVAGIMGGYGTDITDKTTMVLLESANFNQAVIHKGSIDLKLSSEASMRFEKGLSPELSLIALKRATQLIQEIAGGKALKGVVDVYPGRKEKKPILVSTTEVKRLLGMESSYDQMVNALESLGFMCKATAKTGEASVEVPWWRTDVNCAADMVEEVARIFGYDNIPITQLSGPVPEGGASTIQTMRNALRRTMVSCGFQEVLNYSLTNLDTLKKLRPDQQYEGPELLNLAHPMSRELESLRTSLRPGILMTLSRNQRYQQKNLKLFELGKIFLRVKGDLPVENEILCGALCDEQEELFWGAKPDRVDFYAAKGIVETLLSGLGLQASFSAGNDPGFLPGNQAAITVNGASAGVLGQLHPAVTAAFDVSGRIFLFEIELEKILPAVSTKYVFKSMPRYPGVTRDVALIVDDAISYQQILDSIKGYKLIADVSLFDYYKGEQVPAGKKSMAFRVLFQSEERTLKDEEVDRILKSIVDKLSKELGASRRL